MTLPPNHFYYEFRSMRLRWWNGVDYMYDPWRSVGQVSDLINYLETTKTKMNHWPCAN